MKRHSFTRIVFFAASGFLCFSALGPTPHSIAAKPSRKLPFHPPSYHTGHLVANYGKLPLAFEPNQGQTDPRVQFLSRGSGYTLFITSQEAVLSLKKPKSFMKDHPTKKTWHKNSSFPTPDTSTPTVLHLKLEGAQSGVPFEGQDELRGVSNYFIGKDRSKWLKNVPQYSKVSAKGLYAGVDMVYYGNQGKLEYDFVVQPGSDPGNIHLKVEGAKEVRVNEQGDMELSTEQGKVVFRAPTVYQVTGGSRNPVVGRYKQEEGDRIGFEVKDYDRGKPLVIDPVLDYSTFLGGTGFDWGNKIAVDGSGNAYVVGYTRGADFPVTNPSVILGPQNAFVTELDPTGSTLLFSTYLGGNGMDFGQDIALDNAGDIFVTGYTNSTNFPTVAPLQGTLMGNDNVFVSVIGPGGSSLGFSTYLGGSAYDQGMGIAVDGGGNIYVTGVTDSPDFPTLNAIQPAMSNPNANAFIFKINAGGATAAYSTFLGGNAFDWGSAIAVDGSGNAYIGGLTSSSDFPTVNAFQPTYGGVQDGFVTEVNAAGNAWAYSTFIGGSNAEACYGIKLDGSGNIYVSGNTQSADFPLMNPIQPTLLTGSGNAFVSEIAAAGNSLVYSTYLGGTGGGGDVANGIAVDGSGDAYVGGWTTSTDFPTVNPIQASMLNPSVTSFVTQIAAGGGSLLFSTYLGGTGQDQGSGIALDNTGNIFLTGVTNSADFPTLNPFQSGFAGVVDAYISKISMATPTPTPTSTDTPTDTPTFTPTATPTFTSAFTDTFTFTPTDTPTATFTFTSTNSPTDSPTFTSTGTPTFTFTVTPTPTQPVVQVAVGPAPPPNQTLIPGTSNSSVLQLTITNQSGETVQLTGMTLTASGTGNSATGISNLSIYAIVSGSPVLEAQLPNPFTSTNPAAVPLPIINIPALSSQTFLITFDFSPTASTGTYTLSAANSGALSGQGFSSSRTIQVTGAPVNGAVLTIVNPTPTVTATATVTNTPVINKVTIKDPYPNPVDGSNPLSIPVIAPTGSKAHWTVYTLGFRKVYEHTEPIPGSFGTLSWNLLDQWGVPVSNGLYYIRVDVTGLDHGWRIVKVVVAR